MAPGYPFKVTDCLVTAADETGGTILTGVHRKAMGLRSGGTPIANGA
jgi:hypothetical protein